MARERRRLTPGELAAGAIAILLVLDLFLHWYGYEQSRTLLQGSTASVPVTGWQAFSITDVLILLGAIAIVGLLLLKAARGAADEPISPTVVALLVALFVFVVVLLRFANEPGPNSFVKREVGVWLGMLLALALPIAVFMGLRQAGLTPGDIREQIKQLFTGRGRSRPAD